MHLDFPTSSRKLALARLPMHEKNNRKWCIGTYRAFFSVWSCCLLQMRSKITLWHVWKICKLNRVCVHTDTFFTFQSTLQTRKQLRKTEERWISSLRAAEKIIETYWNQDHTEEERGEIISDCMGTEMHMYTTNYKSCFPFHTEKQAVHKVAQNKLEPFECFRLSNNTV